MKSIINYILAIVMLSMTAFSIHAAKYEYRTVPNDPLKAKLYTLPNGLKIYMTVNKDQPRIQTYIAVRVGGKNDPAETTGLAHYFEHLMFKGTQNFGTSDYKAEEPLLDEIERLFEVYRKTTDEAERAALYHRIDSVSYEASKIAIPNEYDKLMAAIGASGTNAFTSYDVTCYTEDIPSNQIENWARIQADRFEHPVLRGFHTELETIYEEKNRSLTSDSRKAYEKMLSLLFPNHPYGTQTVLGTQEHLKNPSITNVKNYHSQWYVPNNMAICVSGDFDPDNMVNIITKYFGNLKPNPNLPVLKFKEEAPITTPIKGDVMGNESEMLFIGWPFPGAGSREVEVLDILSSILSNQGDAGLIDIDINQQHKALAAGAGMYNMADRTAFMLIGAPKEGQTLDEVRDLLLAEIDKLRKGEFDESLIEATINNYKRNVQSSIESNDNRVSMFLDSFVNGTDWADDVASIDRQSKLTKKDIVNFANKYLGDNNYAIVYKRQGKDTTELKMSKPALTPIVMNREMSSDFLKEIQSSNVKPIEPVFLDYNKDLTIFNTKKSNIPVLYKKNETNGLFDLTYVFEMGNRHNRLLGTAAQYLDLLGTKDMTAEQIKNELYRLGCTFYISPNTDRLYVRINGLSENMPQAVALVEKLMNEAVVDTEAYNGLVSRILKSRDNNKSSESANQRALQSYMIYGDAAKKLNLTNDELLNLDPAKLTEAIRDLNSYKHRIIYYGPYSETELTSLVDREHKTPAALKDVPNVPRLKMRETTEPIIYVAPYDSKQLKMMQYSNNGEKYNPSIEPVVTLYNEYFGGSMNSIVFQEMRESRSLAYSAGAYLSSPSYLDQPYVYITSIGTQNDKLFDAINAFDEIINNMPQSAPAFALAKEGLDARLRTEREIKDMVAWSYINAQDLGETTDVRRRIFEALPSLTLENLTDFQKADIAGRTYNYCILANIDDIDLDALGKLGKVVVLTTDDIFGY